METVKSIQCLTLDLPPSCVEFCPAHPSYFCVGTYSLQNDEARAKGDLSRPQRRYGSVVVFQLVDDTIQHVQTVVQPSAVLDLHFQQVAGRRDIFAVASSTASLSILRLAPSPSNTSPVELVSVVRIPGLSEDVLFLSCAWHPNVPDLLGVSTSTGAVYLLALDGRLQLCSLSSTPVLLHQLEAWTVSFSPFALEHANDNLDENVLVTASRVSNSGISGAHKGQTAITIYSGGDDSSLLYTSCSLCFPFPTNDSPLCHALYDDHRLAGHEAGVTAILPVTIATENGDHIVVTGSYDDHIRVYSICKPTDTGNKQPSRCLAVKNLGGGVWRLKLMRESASDDGRHWSLRVLVSCMHAGACVVDINGTKDGSCAVSTVARFEEHKSMNYGSDNQPFSPLCVSTSFYDKLMCLWKIEG